MTENENKNEIIELENVTVELKDSDILNADYGFDEKIEQATKVAESLKRVIESQDLSVNIAGHSYVLAEGWEVLGVLLGCSAIVEDVVEIPTEKKHKYIYRADVKIVQGGRVISRASAIAERNNSQRDRYAVFSMAQTRALGKAYRIALSWIVKMAGYSPSVAEEMPGFKQRRSD